MPNLLQPYSALLITAAALSATMAVASLKMRPTLGTRSFAVLMSAVAMWAFLTFFEFIAQDWPTKIFSYSLKYLFIVAVPVAWLSFGLYYANRLCSWSMGRLMGLMVIPALTLIMVATNPLHHLMFTAQQLQPYRGGGLIFSNFGPWFWVHAVYSYALLFIGFFSLAKSLSDATGPYRRQLISLLIGGLTPWVCNMIFIFKSKPFPSLDLTPFAFSISGLAFLWGIMRYRLLDIVPIARDIVIHNLGDGIVVVDDKQRILDANPKAACFFGMTPQALIGRNADQIAEWWCQIQTDNQKAPNGRSTIFALTVEGRTRWVEAVLSILGTGGRSRGYLVVLRDITAQKNFEETLHRSEERFKSLSENAPVLIFALDESGIVSYVNPTWMKILGYGRQEVLGQPFSHYIESDSHDSFTEIFKQIIEGHRQLGEINLHLMDCDGRKRIFSTTVALNMNSDGCTIGIIGMAKDITAEIKLQEQLLMARKMEAIGTLAGSIAHDFNNLLMGIQANISLLWLETENVKPLQEKLLRIEDQIQTGAGLTRQLLGYARKGKFHVRAVDMHDLIDDALNIVLHTKKNIQIERRLTDAPLVVDADRGQIQLVLLNLFINAVDAMPMGGRLTLSCRLTDNKEVAAHWSDLRPGRYIELTVADTGIGMDESTRERIFDPFFTTKEIGRGTGLGLASVYGVVHNHSGRIRVESQKGQGTTFTIVFPASAENPPPVAAKVPQLTPAHLPSGTLLVVDDEPTILELSQEMIQSLGFKVIAATGGEEAVRIYRQHQASIDLVLLDIIMPSMDGWTVFQEMKKINAKVKVIITSGYGITRSKKRILSGTAHGTLQKPYTRTALAQMIAKVLATQPPADSYPRLYAEGSP